MDTFLDSFEFRLKNKNNTDQLNEKYLSDINNNLLIPILSKLDMCEELIKFNEIFNLPYNEDDYKRIFKEILERIK
tara:strand:+ start:413 stop:640 length:228 start_codon:yes stop_codon:yes gene_type:complete